MGEVKEQTTKQEQLPMEEILKCYIKNQNGAIFHTLAHKTKRHIAILRSGNNYYEKPILELKQGLVDGTWFPINEHEYRKWIKEDNEKVMVILRKMLKRIMLAQLLIELDDELIEDHEGDKYFRNILEKSNKQAERIVNKQYDQLYNVDKNITVNLMNEIDAFTKKAASLNPEDFPVLNILIDRYKENPEQFGIEELEFIEQQ